MSSTSATQTLGTAIRARRFELGLTQEELAARIGGGLRQSEISRLERDRVTLPRRPRLEAIAAALELPVGELLARSGWAGAEHAIGQAPSNAERSRDYRPFEQTAATDDELDEQLHEATAHPPLNPVFERLRRAQERSAEIIESFRALEQKRADATGASRPQSQPMDDDADGSSAPTP